MASTAHTLSGPGGVSLELPRGLREAPELTGGGVALAAVADPWPWPDTFRPRLVVETQPLEPDRATVPQLSSRLIADLLARGLHVAACDVWMVPGVEDGRRIISLFAAMDNTIIRMQYVAIRGGRSVLLTAEHDAGNHRTGEVVFRDSVGSLSCSAEDPVPEPDPATIPRLDHILLEHGHELEDLSAIRGAQPYRSAGPPVVEEQIEALRAGKMRGVDTAGLEAHGLVGRRGRLTEAGEAVHLALEAPGRRVTAEVVDDRGLRVARLDIHQRQFGSVLLADPPPGAPDGEKTLDLVATGTTAIGLARWLGLAPAWAMAITDDDEVPAARFESTVLDARLTDAEAAPPDGAADGLVRMWTQPWQVITLRANVPVERVMRVIATPRSGYFRLERDEPTREASLTPLPSALFLLDLLWCAGFDLTRS